LIWTLRGGVKYDTVDSLNSIPLTLPTGDIIHLSDIARVYLTSGEASSISKYNGSDNITISITKRQSAFHRQRLPLSLKSSRRDQRQKYGVNLNVFYNASDLILNAVSTVAKTLLYGALLAMLVLLLFLGDWRASLIVGSSIQFRCWHPGNHEYLRLFAQHDDHRRSCHRSRHDGRQLNSGDRKLFSRQRKVHRL
jgi:multidrug efflux pump subunit AcrB